MSSPQKGITSIDKIFIANAVQFMRPNGCKRTTFTDLPMEVKPLYDDMVLHKCRFELEVLNTGVVSVTISNCDDDKTAQQ